MLVEPLEPDDRQIVNGMFYEQVLHHFGFRAVNFFRRAVRDCRDAVRSREDSHGAGAIGA